jgi:transcriptional regulator with XRE-family HTH domain
MQMVRELRERAPMTQQELADRARVRRRDGTLRPLSWQTVSDIERGVSRPRPSTVRALAKALGVRPDQLAG